MGVLIGVYSITDLCIFHAILEHKACVICVLFHYQSTTIQLKYIQKYFLSHLHCERGDWREVFFIPVHEGKRAIDQEAKGRDRTRHVAGIFCTYRVHFG